MTSPKKRKSYFTKPRHKKDHVTETTSIYFALEEIAKEGNRMCSKNVKEIASFRSLDNLNVRKEMKNRTKPEVSKGRNTQNGKYNSSERKLFEDHQQSLKEIHSENDKPLKRNWKYTRNNNLNNQYGTDKNEKSLKWSIKSTKLDYVDCFQKRLDSEKR
ncbi:29670_t:CDS:2 [Gigaspora margarita]|uniref:29670_t:CDS:1 n=1 Tax=Gigaspora margarita TaxID=4874 RepID=A0ABN7VPA3_GIGMA|nr:29670_t:CDS:2 [Gigaspora margarita]